MLADFTNNKHAGGNTTDAQGTARRDFPAALAVLELVR